MVSSDCRGNARTPIVAFDAKPRCPRWYVPPHLGIVSIRILHLRVIGGLRMIDDSRRRARFHVPIQ
jgi:hypothetical protein